MRDHAEVAIRSCNASGKTYTASKLVPWWLFSYPMDSLVVTTAPTWRQVKEVLWREIRHTISGKSLFSKNSITETKINESEKWFAIGLSTDRPDQFQGFHSAHLLVIVDEASGVPEEIFEAVDGLRPDKIVYLGNPLHNIGTFAKCFTREGVKKIKISAFDTPNVIAGEVKIPGLVTHTDIERIRSKYGEDSDVYRVRVLGDFPKADADTLIGVGEVADAMAREVKVIPQWEKKMGVDVARYGDDRSAIVVRHNDKVIRKEIYAQQDTMAIAGLALKIAKEEYVLPQNIFVDVIGVGAGVADRMKEQGWRVTEVNVTDAAEDGEKYANKRCELYNWVKEWLPKADLPDDDDYYELALIKYKFNSRGQMILESKEDMRKQSVSSPDVADALALTFARPKVMFQTQASEAVKPYYDSIGF